MRPLLNTMPLARVYDKLNRDTHRLGRAMCYRCVKTSVRMSFPVVR
jgi:hypothetical protein